VNWLKSGFVAAVALVALSTTAPAQSGPPIGWSPRLVICDVAGCREPPGPYWEGPWRVQRPCREWRSCYWHQKWW
jgi:hypothetical protein